MNYSVDIMLLAVALHFRYLKEAFDMHLHLKTDRTPIAYQTFNSLGIVYNAIGKLQHFREKFYLGIRKINHTFPSYAYHLYSEHIVSDLYNKTKMPQTVLEVRDSANPC